MKRVLLAAVVLVVSGCGESGEKQNVFLPEEQQPFFEKGLILPPHSFPCIPESTGVPQNECNHHGSTVEVLPDGTVAAVWFHGENEKSHDSWNVWSKLEPGAESWTEPEVIFDEPGRAEGNAALWVKKDGTLAVIFVTIFGRDWWDDSKIRMIQSEDGGETWAEPTVLREEYCWMVRHRPIRLSGGRMVLPLYEECWALPVFMYSDDEFETWWEQDFEDHGQYMLDHALATQPALIERSDGSVVAIMRDGGSNRRIHRMKSDDLGDTWSAIEPTQLPNSDTSVDWVRLLDGHVVAVFNNSPDHRFPLTAALSTDEGETFTAVRHLNDECPEGGCSYHYPSITQSHKDGTIWVTYTHKRETIGWIHFNEAWLMQGGDELNTNPLP